MKTKTQASLIGDGQRLVSATIHGYAIPTYDDGFGRLFVWQTTLGNFGMVGAIVRAQTLEDAYSICEDEFFPAGDEAAAEDSAEIEACEDEEDKIHLQNCFEEAYGYRGNGRKEKDGSMSYVYAKDLNGDSLDLLTPELLARLEITLQIENGE
jgi:hypothetical protein